MSTNNASPETTFHSLRIGIDIGGTFTDFVVYDPTKSSIETFKLPSTPGDPSLAVIQGLQQIRSKVGIPSPADYFDIIHGSTVATNALLERKGARTAFVTTAGFKDILQIGRQNRPALYDWFSDASPGLVPQDLRFEVLERVGSAGQVLRPVDQNTLPALISALSAASVESVAICFLFSFLHPEHERIVAEAIRSTGVPVSSSAEILLEFREYERASTTVVNAYVSPVLDRYLSHLGETLSSETYPARIQMMQSNGGALSLDEARRRGVNCILSGPAGGVLGAKFIAETVKSSHTTADNCCHMAENEPIRYITFDMGGTSTDVSLIDGVPGMTTEAIVGGCPIRIPMYDIHTIGAGGGSIAYVDAGGALRVGPQSAGAEPGPACYGRGELPTVTDANLVLGRLPPDLFLGGQIQLEEKRSEVALERLGAELGMGRISAALGVTAVVNAHMERALRVTSMERGFDPRLFSLLSFGGAGGLHAADLARGLGIRRVLVPPLASTLSAFGMLAADLTKDTIRTVMLPGDTPLQSIDTLFDSLIEQTRSDMAVPVRPIDRSGSKSLIIEKSVDLRYLGQSYELTVPYSVTFKDDFHALHRRLFGYAREQAQTELVNLRVRVIQSIDPVMIEPKPYQASDPRHAILDWREMVIGPDGRFGKVAVYQGEALQPGSEIPGPALVARSDTTILIGADDSAVVDGFSNLWIEVKA